MCENKQCPASRIPTAGPIAGHHLKAGRPAETYGVAPGRGRDSAREFSCQTQGPNRRHLKLASAAGSRGSRGPCHPLPVGRACSSE